MWSKKENWLFCFAALGTLASLVVILEYFGIAPTAARPSGGSVMPTHPPPEGLLLVAIALCVALC
jgi:hypothetical protein